jgi:hypothetical protein
MPTAATVVPLGVAFQIAFNAVCISRKTPEAVTIKVMIPIIVATTPDDLLAGEPPGPQLRLDLGGRDEGRYSPPNPAYKTWSNCPPNFTVQDGLCKPYRGR